MLAMLLFVPILLGAAQAASFNKIVKIPLFWLLRTLHHASRSLVPQRGHGEVVTDTSKSGDEVIAEYMEVCARNDPKLDSCVSDKLKNLFVAMKDGVPEFDLPSFDPLLVDETLVEFKQEDANAQLSVRNSKVYGLSGIKIGNVRTKLNDSGVLRMEIDIKIPTAFIEGEYKGSGKVVAFPINGKGVYNISMTDISATWNLTGNHFTKQGKNYVRIAHFEMFPKVGGMKVYASNLFTGSDEFNKAALTFANEFWPVLYNEMLPYVNESWDKTMRGLANRVFLKVPFDQLFPEQ